MFQIPEPYLHQWHPRRRFVLKSPEDERLSVDRQQLHLYPSSSLPFPSLHLLYVHLLTVLCAIVNSDLVTPILLDTRNGFPTSTRERRDGRFPLHP